MNRWKFQILSSAVTMRLLAVWATLALALLAATALKAQISFVDTQISVAGDALGMACGAAADGRGNLYIADCTQGQVVMVPATAGVFGAPVTILSGLSNPEGIAADWSGNVYVADTGNNRIMMLPLAASGNATAVQVGSGFNSPASVAVDSAGNLYVADTGNNAVFELPHIGNGYGSAILLVSGFNGPMGVAVDAAKNLYIADTGNNRVIKQYFTAGGYTTRLILAQGLVAPTAVSVDKSSNLFITYAGTGRVIEDPWAAGARRYSSTIVVGSNFTSPSGVVEDWSGNLFVADRGSNRVIEVVTRSIGFGARSLGGSAPAQTYNFSISAGTTIGGIGIYTQGATGQDYVDGGGSSCLAQTYVTATLCGVNVAFSPLTSGQRMGAIVMYDPLGNSLATAFLSGSGAAPQAAFLPGTTTVLGAELSGPAGVAVDGSGNVYIA